MSQEVVSVARLLGQPAEALQAAATLREMAHAGVDLRSARTMLRYGLTQPALRRTCAYVLTLQGLDSLTLHRAPEVRAGALEAGAGRLEALTDPDPEVRALARQLPLEDVTPELAYWWMHRAPERARQLLERGLLPGVCDEVIRGTHIWECSVCHRLPPHVTVRAEEELPLHVAVLVPSGEEERRCPECGAEYRLVHERVYDDMDLEETWELTRTR